MKLFPFLVILIMSVCIAHGYTLPATSIDGNLNMTSHNIISLATPINDTDVATKAYADSIVASGGLPLTGGVMTGQIDHGGFVAYNSTTPVNDSDLSTKKYVDDSVAPFAEIEPSQINNSLPFENITMDEGENITLDGGWILNESISSLGANPATYGAVGDGVTDDTLPIKYALNNSTKTVLTPGKTYLVSASINPTVLTNKTLSGYGATLLLSGDFTLMNISDKNVTIEGFKVVVPVASTGHVFEFNTDYWDLRFRDVSFYSTADADYEAIQILGNGYGSVFSDVTVWRSKIGINSSPTTHMTDNSFNNIKIINAEKAFHLNGDDVHGNTFDNINIIHGRTTPSIGFDIVKAWSNKFTNVVTWYDGPGTFKAVDLGADAKYNEFTGYLEGIVENDGIGNVLPFDHIDRTGGSAELGYNTSYSRVRNPYGTQNLIPDGSFDLWASSQPLSFYAVTTATDLSASTDNISALYSLKIAGDGVEDTGHAASSIDFTPRGSEVTVGMWAKAPITNNDDTAKVYLTATDWSNLVNVDLVNDGLWHWIQLGLRPDPTKAHIVMVYPAGTGVSDDYVLIDDVVVVDGPVAPMSPSEYVSSGLLKFGAITIAAGATTGAWAHGMRIAPSYAVLGPTSVTDSKIWYVSAKNATHVAATINSASAAPITFDCVASWV